jgi:predicted RNase H-like nuclease (RuvC/YqgF family)
MANESTTTWLDWINSMPVGAALMAGFTAILNRKKSATEVKTGELSNVQDAIKIWRETAERLELMVKEMASEIVKMEERINTLDKENRDLRRELDDLKKENQRLDKIVKQYTV